MPKNCFEIHFLITKIKTFPPIQETTKAELQVLVDLKSVSPTERITELASH